MAHTKTNTVVRSFKIPLIIWLRGDAFRAEGCRARLSPSCEVDWEIWHKSRKGSETSIFLASSPDVEGVAGTYFVKSIPRRSAAISYDESLQRQLWEQSAILVNL